MHKQLATLLQGDRMPVPTDRWQLLPKGRLCIIDLDIVDRLFRVISAPAHDDQLTAHEANQMLVSADWYIVVSARGSVPVPHAVPVFDQSPDIVQC
jgi:hypothetical protein